MDSDAEVISIHERSKWAHMSIDELRRVISLYRLYSTPLPHDLEVEAFYRMRRLPGPSPAPSEPPRPSA